MGIVTNETSKFTPFDKSVTDPPKKILNDMTSFKKIFLIFCTNLIFKILLILILQSPIVLKIYKILHALNIKKKNLPIRQ